MASLLANLGSRAALFDEQRRIQNRLLDDAAQDDITPDLSQKLRADVFRHPTLRLRKRVSQRVELRDVPENARVDKTMVRICIDRRIQTPFLAPATPLLALHAAERTRQYYICSERDKKRWKRRYDRPDPEREKQELSSELLSQPNFGEPMANE